jgi:hypothetical protein
MNLRNNGKSRMAIDTVLELQVVMNCRLWIRDSRKVFVLFVEMERDVAILGGVCERDFVLCVRGLNAFNTMKTRSRKDRRNVGGGGCGSGVFDYAGTRTQVRPCVSNITFF